MHTEELYNVYSSPDISGASEIGHCFTELGIERVIERHHIHLLTYLLIYLLIYFLTYLLTYLLIYLLTYLITYSMEQSPS